MQDKYISKMLISRKYILSESFVVYFEGEIIYIFKLKLTWKSFIAYLAYMHVGSTIMANRDNEPGLNARCELH